MEESTSRRLTPEQQELVVRYMPRAANMAVRCEQGMTREREGFKSAAYVGLIESAFTFDPSKTDDFWYHARIRVRGAVKDYKRWVLGGRNRAKVSSKVQRQFGSLGADCGQVMFRTPEPPVGSAIESSDEFESMLSQLPQRHASALRSICCDGKNHTETAELIGCSVGMVTKLIQEARAHLTGSRERKHRNGPPPTGYKGAVQAKGVDNYRAQLRFDGRMRRLGSFRTPQEAHDACVKFAEEHGMPDWASQRRRTSA